MAIIMNLIRIFNREKTLLTTLKNKQNVDDLLVEIENNLVSDAKTTTHFFNDDMPDNIKPKLDIVNNEILELLGPEYKSISKINEIYFTAKKTGNSDLSFTSLHTDSPFFPCKTYRVLVCIKPNDNVTTIIPDDNIEKKLEKYDILGFDYANTFHYIKFDETNSSESRIVLKFHYSKTDICNKLTERYTRWARDLYVNNKDTIHHSGNWMLFFQSFSSNLIFLILFYCLIMYFYFASRKQNNILMYILLTGSFFAYYLIFIFMGSFLIDLNTTYISSLYLSIVIILSILYSITRVK
jgi:hypothetical protein